MSYGGSGSATGSTAVSTDTLMLRQAYFSQHNTSSRTPPPRPYIRCIGEPGSGRLGIRTYNSGHVLGDKQGGTANYWNLFPQHDQINGGTGFVPGGAGRTGLYNPWNEFAEWASSEVIRGIGAGDAYPAVYVFFKFVYRDAIWWTEDEYEYYQQIVDGAPRIVMFYGISMVSGSPSRFKMGYITNFPNLCEYHLPRSEPPGATSGSSPRNASGKLTGA